MSLPEEPVPPRRMTADEYLDWVVRQPEGRFELVDGEVVRMASERLVHVQVKFAAALALRQAVRARGLRCGVLGDGMAVRIDDGSVFEPDAQVRCGPDLPGDTLVLTDPIVVVEVISPSSDRVDTGRKFWGYFTAPSLWHYLILDPDHRRLVHHERLGDGRIESRILHAWPDPEGRTLMLTFDPPGLTLPAADLFEAP